MQFSHLPFVSYADYINILHTPLLLPLTDRYDYRSQFFA